MNLVDIEPLISIARNAGYVIDKWDYDFGVGAKHPHKKVAVFISEVFRPDVDGYSGYRLITESNLLAWIKSNPIEKEAANG